MRRAIAAFAAALAAPALCVGLGPLVKEGVIDGPREAFYLTLYNPYPLPTDFVAYPIGFEDEDSLTRVAVLPKEVRVAGRASQRLLVIADELTVGETFNFRVCAERKTPPEGIEIHARVCSKLTARRIG